MSNRFKCYVCSELDDELCWNIIKVFWYRKDAIAWVEKDKSRRVHEEFLMV